MTSLFNEMREETKLEANFHLNSRILVVDALQLYIRAFAATPTMDDEGDHIGGITGFLRSLGAAITLLKPTRVILIFDGAGGSQRRRHLFPDYKANRKSMTRLNRTYGFDTIQTEKKAQKWQLIALVKILENLPVTVMALDHIEADDAIAYVAQLQSQRDNDVIILSTDRDFLQLVDDKVKVFNPVRKKIYGESEVIEEYKIHPKNFLLYRMADGDKSDNIPGIKGLGPALLVKNFPQMSGSISMTVDEMIRCAGLNQESKICQKIVESKETLERNYSLMRLDEIDISGVTKLKIVEMMDKFTPKLDKATMTKLFSDYKLWSQFKNYNEWVLNTWAPLLRFRA